MTARPCRLAMPAVWLALLGGCSSFIPSSGPTLRTITGSSAVMVQNAPGPQEGFALIQVDAPIANRLSHPEASARFGAANVDRQPPALAVGVGDVLQITVFEAGSGGLFIPADAGSRPGNFVQLPPQQVGQDRDITVPWAGRVRVAGRTPIQIQADIQGRLGQRALDPQVVVSFVERHGNEVSVLGDVGLATRFSLDASGERILGAIARAQGPKFPVYESKVTLQRAGRTETALLSEIAQDPTQNIAIQPGDVVYVSHEPRYFLAVGATGQTTTLSQLDRRFPFGDRELSLADALAKAGGLQDDRANARAVFLYRMEPKLRIAAMGLDVPATLPDSVPTIYQLDMTEAGAFFLANRIAMRSGDTIYVSNAPITEINKVLTLLLPFSQSASFVRSTAQ